MRDVLGGGVEPTIQVQLHTLGGQVYLMPMSVRAARDMLVALTN
jgi:ribosomal protein S7